MDIEKYWRDVLRQDAAAIRAHFDKNAFVNWHNSNEHFTVEEFIRANCEYPGRWDGRVERVEILGDLTITVAHVRQGDGEASFHVTSFIKTGNDKILSIDEYWGDDGPPPRWRLDKGLGSAIVQTRR